MGRGLSPSHVLHPFLLALHTNLAADVAKLGVRRAHIGEEDTRTYTDCNKIYGIIVRVYILGLAALATSLQALVSFRPYGDVEAGNVTIILL